MALNYHLVFAIFAISANGCHRNISHYSSIPFANYNKSVPATTSTTGGIKGITGASHDVPLSGFTVTCIHANGREWSVVSGHTGNNGEFKIGLLPPGIYTVTIDINPEDKKSNKYRKDVQPWKETNLRVLSNTWIIIGDNSDGSTRDLGGVLYLRPLGHGVRYQTNEGNQIIYAYEELRILP